MIEDKVDLFYLTGLSLSSGQLLVTPKETLLLVDGRYIEKAQKNRFLPCSLNTPSALSAFFEKQAAKTIGFDGMKMPFSRVEELKKEENNFSWICRNEITKIGRVIKDKEEIAAMQRSANLLWRGYQHVKNLLKEGISEKELAVAFTVFCLEQGAERLAFDPIVAFGANSAMPHHRAGDKRLVGKEIALLDLGLVLEGYHSDMTRMVCQEGGDPLLQEWLAIVQEAHAAALALCLPGTLVGQLDEAARAVFRRYGVEQYFLHSLGHGIGIETHEYPRIRTLGADANLALEPGMVFTIEPGLYMAGRGGIRYEDMIVITETGHYNLFESLSEKRQS